MNFDLTALKGRRLALGVGGGIAAYKACELVRELMRSGAEVRVAMTPSAQKFVSPLTFQALSGAPVLTDYFNPAQEENFGHLDFARWAEAYVVAPATADLIAKMRAGLADDPVSTSLLAFTGPVLFAPAMNVAMFKNPATQDNLKHLVEQRGFRQVGPDAGLLACGDVGAGRLAEVSEIVTAVASVFEAPLLAGKRVLITAGPTREYLDPVRFLSNPSSGKMGLAVASAARRLGAEVTVVLGPVSETAPRDVTVVPVVSAEDMRTEVLARLSECDYLVAAAAVSDFRPESRAQQKVKKTSDDENVKLVRTPDVLLEASRAVRGKDTQPILIGFAAETERVLEHAREKLSKKALDFIVANDVSKHGRGFGSDDNAVTVLSRDGAQVELSGRKQDLASQIWKVVLGQPRSASSGTAGNKAGP